MDRINENEVRIEQILYKQDGKVEVSKVFHHRTGKSICMKKIFVENVLDATYIQGEFVTMAHLQHKNILALKSASLGGHDRNITHVVIFMDYFEEGDLEKLIQNKARSGVLFEQEQLIEYFKQMIDAYAYMQSEEVAHRDIKPQNIFVCDNGKTLKVGDLGSAVKKNSDSGGTLMGTPLYLSPKLREVYLSNSKFQVINHDVFKSDVYSLGLTFLYMASLKSVKDLCTLFELEKKIAERIRELPENYNVVKEILGYMLEVDESERMNFLQLKERMENPHNDPKNKPGKELAVKVLKKGEMLKLRLTKLLELKGNCENCHKEFKENQIYYISGHLICFTCFSNFRNQSPV